MVCTLLVSGDALYAGGSFSRIAAQPCSGLAKLTPTGAVDPLFRADTGGRWVCALAMATNGLFVGGNFSTINGVLSPCLAKLDPSTGAPDTSFQAQVGDIEAASCVLGFSVGEGLKLLGIPGGKY